MIEDGCCFRCNNIWFFGQEVYYYSKEWKKRVSYMKGFLSSVCILYVQGLLRLWCFSCPDSWVRHEPDRTTVKCLLWHAHALMLCWKPVVTLLYSLGKGESKAMVFSSWKRAHRCHIFFFAALVSGGFSAQWWWQLPLELSPGGIHSNTQVGACRLSLLAGTQSSPSSVPRKICSP